MSGEIRRAAAELGVPAGGDGVVQERDLERVLAGIGLVAADDLAVGRGLGRGLLGRRGGHRQQGQGQQQRSEESSCGPSEIPSRSGGAGTLRPAPGLLAAWRLGRRQVEGVVDEPEVAVGLRVVAQRAPGGRVVPPRRAGRSGRRWRPGRRTARGPRRPGRWPGRRRPATRSSGGSRPRCRAGRRRRGSGRRCRPPAARARRRRRWRGSGRRRARPGRRARRRARTRRRRCRRRPR